MNAEVQEEIETKTEKKESINRETEKTGNKDMKLGIVVFVVIVLAITAYLAMSGRNVGQNVANQVSTQSTPTTTESGVTGSVGNPTETAIKEIKEILVEGDEFSFNPALINLTEGENVRLTFNNIGKYPHDLIIDGLGVATKTVAPGGSDVVEFIVDKTGSFNFYCSIGTHKAQGMEGEVVVE